MRGVLPAGGGIQQSDALWAHAWTILENVSGGPGDGPGIVIPETQGQGPQGLGIWAGDYTLDPEDGEIGVRIQVEAMTPSSMTIWVDNVK